VLEGRILLRSYAAVIPPKLLPSTTIRCIFAAPPRVNDMRASKVSLLGSDSCYTVWKMSGPGNFSGLTRARALHILEMLNQELHLMERNYGRM